MTASEMLARVIAPVAWKVVDDQEHPTIDAFYVNAMLDSITLAQQILDAFAKGQLTPVAETDPTLRASLQDDILAQLPEFGPHINMSQYRDGVIEGMRRAARIVGKTDSESQF